MNTIQINQNNLQSKLSAFLEGEVTITSFNEFNYTNVYKAFGIDHGRDNKPTFLHIILSLNSSNEVYASVEMDIEGLRDIGGFILVEEGVNN